MKPSLAVSATDADLVDCRLAVGNDGTSPTNVLHQGSKGQAQDLQDL